MKTFVATYTDSLDLENLQWLGIFIRISISERQQELLDKYQETSGPEMFIRLAVSSYSGHLTLERDASYHTDEECTASTGSWRKCDRIHSPVP